MTLQQQLDKHFETNCPACVASVTSMNAPACPVTKELYRQLFQAAKKAKKVRLVPTGFSDPGELAADRWLENQVGI